MTAMTDLVEQLLLQDEGATLDFKQAQYALGTDEQKGEFIKDLLAFSNAFRREDAYILVGVQDVQGGRATVVGVTEHLPESDLQQIVNSKTNRTLEFSYHAIEIDGKQVGAIRIPRQERPTYLRKPYGKLLRDAAYLRRGSSTSIANPDEIKRMALEDYPPANDPEIKALQLLQRRARFSDRVWLLIETMNQHPEHYLIIAQSEAYNDFRREQRLRFNEEYHAFQQDMSTAADLLTAKQTVLSAQDQAAITLILDAVRNVRETVQTLVSASYEQFACNYTNARKTALNAAQHLAGLTAERIVGVR